MKKKRKAQDYEYEEIEGDEHFNRFIEAKKRRNPTRSYISVWAENSTHVYDYGTNKKVEL